MKFNKLPLNGAFTIELERNQDERGFFARYWCKKEFKEFGLDVNISQINNSLSRDKGTLRGLHFQYPPRAEAKIIRCLSGAIRDVIVDIRKSSNTYGQWCGVELNDDNRSMIYVPKGFAHGFQTLVNDVELLYLHSEFYSPKHESGLLFNDKTINIDWPLPVSEISERDKFFPTLDQLGIINL